MPQAEVAELDWPWLKPWQLATQVWNEADASEASLEDHCSFNDMFTYTALPKVCICRSTDRVGSLQKTYKTKYMVLQLSWHCLHSPSDGLPPPLEQVY